MSAINGQPDKATLLRRLAGRNPRDDELPYERPNIHIIADDGGIDLQWIWPQRLPKGKLSLLVGYPGVGKSMLAADIAARCSAGLPWPDEPLGCVPPPECAERMPDDESRRTEDQEQTTMPQVRRPEGVVFVSVEDEIADTIVNRAVSAGCEFRNVAALDRIVASESPTFDLSANDSERNLTLDRDLHHIERIIEEWIGVGLVIIDPLLSLCDAADSEPNLRRMLNHLARLAKYHCTAILAVAHLRDEPSRTNIYRALGSRALATIPRTIWSLQVDPVEPDRRLLLPLKMNLGPMPAGLSFAFGKDRLDWDPQPVQREAASSAASPARSAVDEAIQFLRDTLSVRDLAAPEVYPLGQKCGFSAKTLQRAKAALGVAAYRRGFGDKGVWFWSLPQRYVRDAAESQNGRHRLDLDPLTTYGTSADGEVASLEMSRGCDPVPIDGQ